MGVRPFPWYGKPHGKCHAIRLGSGCCSACHEYRQSGLGYSARDLMPWFDYDKWDRFEGAIERTETAARNQDIDVDYHFPGAGKTGATRGGTAPGDPFHRVVEAWGWQGRKPRYPAMFRFAQWGGPYVFRSRLGARRGWPPWGGGVVVAVRVGLCGPGEARCRSSSAGLGRAVP
jgi:hypothetical protein